MIVRFTIDLKILDQKNAVANNYSALNAALSKFRGEVKTVKDCLDDPLGSVQKWQLRLDAAHKRNERLDRKFTDLQVQYMELENCLGSRGRLQDHIEVLESGVKEKDKEIARITQQNNELRNLRSPQKITDFDSADDLTISDGSSIIGKLEKEKRDLLEQLQMVIRERDVARRDKEIMQEVFKSNEDSRGKLREENNTLCQQVASLKAQRQPASPASLSAPSAGRSTSVGSLQLSGSSMTHVPRGQAATSLYTDSNTPSTPVRQPSGSFGNRNFTSISPARNNNRRISSASPLSRPRPTLTRTQERVITTVQHLPDDHLEALESGGAFESVEKGHHWVKGVGFSLHSLKSS
jgi:hypothetical protein